MIYTVVFQKVHFAITTSFESKENGLWYLVFSLPIFFKRLLTLFRHRGQITLKRGKWVGTDNHIELVLKTNIDFQQYRLNPPSKQQLYVHALLMN